jgi:hypothetical protein
MIDKLSVNRRFIRSSIAIYFDNANCTSKEDMLESSARLPVEYKTGLETSQYQVMRVINIPAAGYHWRFELKGNTTFSSFPSHGTGRGQAFSARFVNIV